MMHARVTATGGAVVCGLVATSLLTRDFMAEQFLPGRSATEWGIGLIVTGLALALAAVVGPRWPSLLPRVLLAACGLHAAFGAVLLVFALTQGTSFVGAVYACTFALVLAREVLRLGGHPW